MSNQTQTPSPDTHPAEYVCDHCGARADGARLRAANESGAIPVCGNCNRLAWRPVSKCDRCDKEADAHAVTVHDRDGGPIGDARICDDCRMLVGESPDVDDMAGYTHRRVPAIPAPVDTPPGRWADHRALLAVAGPIDCARWLVDNGFIEDVEGLAFEGLDLAHGWRHGDGDDVREIFGLANAAMEYALREPDEWIDAAHDALARNVAAFPHDDATDWDMEAAQNALMRDAGEYARCACEAFALTDHALAEGLFEQVFDQQWDEIPPALRRLEPVVRALDVLADVEGSRLVAGSPLPPRRFVRVQLLQEVALANTPWCPEPPAEAAVLDLSRLSLVGDMLHGAQLHLHGQPLPGTECARGADDRLHFANPLAAVRAIEEALEGHFSVEP